MSARAVFSNGSNEQVAPLIVVNSTYAYCTTPGFSPAELTQAAIALNGQQPSNALPFLFHSMRIYVLLLCLLYLTLLFSTSLSCGCERCCSSEWPSDRRHPSVH